MLRAVITGAAGGIGKECVRQLMAKGDIEVIAISRSKENLLALKEEVSAEFGRELLTIVCDFHKSGFEKEIANDPNIKDGTINYLINNAGLLYNKKLDELSEEELEEQLRINYIAPTMLIKSLSPFLLKAKGRSHVVNIGSMGGYMGSSKFPGLSGYSASKSALAILTECLAVEFPENEVCFNCLALGSANTSMLREAFPDYESPTSPTQIAEFIVNFALNGHLNFNGKVLPVAGVST